MHNTKLNTYFNDFVLQQRSFYETVAGVALLRNDRSRFLNLGYAGDVAENILAEDKHDELSIKLYLKTLEGVERKNIQSAIEIGCGRGGGCYILKQYLKIPEVTGFDMTWFNIQNAKRNTEGRNIRFIHGNILEQIDNNIQYDLVLSVDTCQTYQDFNAFLSNTAKLLRPGGYLAYSDFAFRDDIPYFQKAIHDNHFEVLEWIDLTNAMCRSISTEAPQTKVLPLWQRILLGKKLQRYLVWSSPEIDALLNSGELRYIKYIAKLNQNI